jgi:hypothetical protein
MASVTVLCRAVVRQEALRRALFDDAAALRITLELVAASAMCHGTAASAAAAAAAANEGRQDPVQWTPLSKVRVALIYYDLLSTCLQLVYLYCNACRELYQLMLCLLESAGMC